MEKPTEYKITKTDDELKTLVSKLQYNLSDEGFSDFCNIVTSRATKCWQSGLEDYPFGEKNYSSYQSKNTVLEIIYLKARSGAFDREYVLYVKESLCLYNILYARIAKLKKILI